MIKIFFKNIFKITNKLGYHAACNIYNKLGASLVPLRRHWRIFERYSQQKETLTHNGLDIYTVLQVRSLDWTPFFKCT